MHYQSNKDLLAYLLYTMTFGDTEFAFGTCNLSELKGLNSGVSPEELPNNNSGNDYNNINIFFNSCDKIVNIILLVN